MQRDMSSTQRQFDMGCALAFFAAKHGLTQADFAHQGRGPCADALQAWAGAVVAHVRGQQAALQASDLRLRLFKARLGLVKFRLEFLRYRLSLAARAFKIRGLRPHQLQPLTKDLRAAVFGDQFLDQFEWSHGWPVGLKLQKRVEACDAA